MVVEMEKKKVFLSRISLLLVGFILAIFIYSFILVFNSNLLEEKYIIGAIFILIIFIFSGIHYTISGNRMYMKIWMILIKSVKISQIISIERSYNPLASMASSLKRLKITLEKESKYRFLLISPTRELEFIEKLQMINPKIHIQLSNKKAPWRVLNWDI